MQTTTLYFKREFSTGTLAGIRQSDSIQFATVESAMKWLSDIKKPAIQKRNGWKLVDRYKVSVGEITYWRNV